MQLFAQAAARARPSAARVGLAAGNYLRCTHWQRARTIFFKDTNAHMKRARSRSIRGVSAAKVTQRAHAPEPAEDDHSDGSGGSDGGGDCRALYAAVLCEAGSLGAAYYDTDTGA